MTRILGLLFIVSLLQYVTSEITMVEIGPGVVKPSDTLEMICKVTGASLTDSTNMVCVHWIRQTERKPMDWLGAICYNANIYYGSSVQGRLTVTRDVSKGEVYFKLTGMKTEESGKYHCAREKYAYFDVWGKGTLLTVTSEQITPPSVFPLIPIGQEGNTYVTIGCLASKYFPTPLTVSWSTSAGVTQSGGNNIQFGLSGNPPTYSLVSQIAIKNSDWKSNTYLCDVKHYSTSIQKTIPKGCPTTALPSVYIVQGSCYNPDSPVELTCQASNLTSENAKITWFISDKETNLPQDVKVIGKSDNNLYSIYSKVQIPPEQWNNGVIIKCQVTDTKTSKSAQATAKKCSDMINCLGIKVTLTPPTIEDLYVFNTARISCTAYFLKQATGYQFSFNYAGAPNNLNIETEDPHMRPDGTYSVKAILTVTPDTWNSKKEIACIFKYPGLSEPIIQRIVKKTEERLVGPNLAVYPPTPEDLDKNENCLLTCVAYGFYPDNIFIGWTRNDEEISEDQYVNSEPKISNRNLSYFASSFLTIPCSTWKEGGKFGCLVGHEGNPMKFIRRIVDIYTGKQTKVNVYLNMSDEALTCS